MPETKYDASLTLYLAIFQKGQIVNLRKMTQSQKYKLQRKGIVLFGIVYLTFFSNTSYVLQDPVIYNLQFTLNKTILINCFTHVFD